MIVSRPSTGTGMLAVFCDLEPQWHHEFRAWLRDDMIPARMKIGFAACASFDRLTTVADEADGTEPFVTVYETASTGDLYGAPYQGLRVNRDQRDKDFHARFIKPSRYTLAWVGPELTRVDKAGFAPVAAFDRIDLPDNKLQDFNLWYMTRYLPSLDAIGGVLRVRRYLAMEGSPRHVLVHECEDQAVLESSHWRHARDELARMLPANAHRTSGSYVRVLAVTQE